MRFQIRNAGLVLLAISLADCVRAGAGADNTRQVRDVSWGRRTATRRRQEFQSLSFKDPAMLKATDAQFIASTTNGKGKMPDTRAS